VGVCWRPGNAHTADGAAEWITQIVDRLRQRGVETITVRLDKGFFSRAMAETLEALGVRYVLKVPEHRWALNLLSSWRNSEKDERIWTASGSLYGARLLSCEWRKHVRGMNGMMLALETYAVEKRAIVLTNDPGMHALTAWRTYNQGALVEQRIEELGQLSIAGPRSIISTATGCSGRSGPLRTRCSTAFAPQRSPEAGGRRSRIGCGTGCSGSRRS
jgi:hypothetical protein